MRERGWFYRDEEEFRRIHEKLKLTPCPHCHVVGTLILHGYLRGYDDHNRRRKGVRARSILFLAAVTLLDQWLRRYRHQQAQKKTRTPPFPSK
ncbi:hypothetical protein Pan216_11120 [Planctomycetes bacterium Pan216]|uniref:Uncharacterized protein n=1 Tax=Kolteria novifilia TaxID=2527975 RepID=A0A518AZX5_9BACT|nr:hypothetical protein Pan216_11120 [Planctomycetes bacterium Pan216]